MSDEKLSYSVAEACAALGISRAHFYRLRKKGVIETFPLEGKTLVKAEVLRAVLDNPPNKPHPSKRQQNAVRSRPRKAPPGKPPTPS